MPPSIRRCVSCRRQANRAEFWRVVRLHPTGAVQLDTGMGRSAYLCQEPSCLQLAQKKNRLSKALKAPVPDQVYAALARRLAQHSTRPTTS